MPSTFDNSDDYAERLFTLRHDSQEVGLSADRNGAHAHTRFVVVADRLKPSTPQQSPPA